MSFQQICRQIQENPQKATQLIAKAIEFISDEKKKKSFPAICGVLAAAQIQCIEGKWDMKEVVEMIKVEFQAMIKNFKE